MGRKNIEIYFNVSSEAQGGYMWLVDAETIVLKLNESGKPANESACEGKIGDNFSFTYADAGMLRARVQHALREGLEMDDPVAFPMAALLAARAGKHSSGCSQEDIEAVVKSIMTDSEYEFIDKLSKTQKHPEAVVDWAKRLDDSRLGLVERNGASAYPRPRR